ncbi:hypothetical protein [Nannocystis punicea]|uniref:Uncharacterized protein n=1 Tax=Nannocystis punicea TaxID=2995304 RepID=A0ABY7GYD7_9BACT|nr:hypothetical protein [Nannocystis poenicansa]WAS91895.1 hypothetical protein O0S08_37410 [Nannocystis poenicansa]
MVCESDGASLLARAGFVGGGFEWGILCGKVAERWVVGGSAQGDAGPIGLRGGWRNGGPRHCAAPRDLRGQHLRLADALLAIGKKRPAPAGPRRAYGGPTAPASVCTVACRAQCR